MATLAPPIPPTTDGVRPAKSDIRNLMVACPNCRYWHEIPTSGATHAVRCTCAVDRHGRGVTVWEARPDHARH